MSSSFTVQILNDGPRNTVARIVGIIGSADLSGVTILDPALLSPMFPGYPGQPLAITLSILELQYAIVDGLDVELIWDATTPVVAEFLEGRGKLDYKNKHPLTNNAGAGVTGKILMTTIGGAGITSGGFTILIHTMKNGVL